MPGYTKRKLDIGVIQLTEGNLKNGVLICDSSQLIEERGFKRNKVMLRVLWDWSD